MVALEIYLCKHSYTKDSIGVEKETEVLVECPIIKHEDIYSKEFYEANQQGFKPSLRIVISRLNYDNENELQYNGVRYSIIRTQEYDLDEITLICERKVGNDN